MSVYNYNINNYKSFFWFYFDLKTGFLLLPDFSEQANAGICCRENLDIGQR